MSAIEVNKHPSTLELHKLQVNKWARWEKGLSQLPQHYKNEETCYILEGEAVVTMPDGSVVVLREGCLAKFPPGVECVWNIVRPVSKLYSCH